MHPITFVPVQYYQHIYVLGLFLLCLLVAMVYTPADKTQYVNKSNNYALMGAFILTIVVVAFVGLRPINGHYFVDMKMYSIQYDWANPSSSAQSFMTSLQDNRGEWMFYSFIITCKRLGLNVYEYFLVVDIIYFGLMALVCWRLMRTNMIVALLFFFISFSTFSYGVNGIRNGMACSVALLAITLLTGKRWEQVLSVILMFVAYNLHHSTALPCFCAIVALLWCKKPEYAIYFWIASIFISLVAGEMVTQMFVSMGFDERMEEYANLDKFGEVMESLNPKSGFRIDFILYSIAPIIMAWYVTVKRHFNDESYNIIATTYILANAFWIMVIRSEQNNRFAYLSWFIYPLVIAYPLLRMNIWKDQDRKTAIILMAYASFTFLMTFVYYA